MPLYLYQVAYTPESLAAQIKKPQDRLEIVGTQISEAVGAKIVSGGYSYGEYDVSMIIEAPDEVAMSAVAIAISAGGAIKAAKTTPLLSGTQWVAALKKATTVSQAYKPAR
ncbi:GYD domain-containing protein [Variovorax paradoxus]|nr:GYD domain-containing protein [Variovorax paradoxus]MBT2302427.1 GYD domain-containing protein [Variovorax paradoxus]